MQPAPAYSSSRGVRAVVPHHPPDQWRALAAAKFGWMLDAMDFMLYAMAIGQLRDVLRVQRCDRRACSARSRWSCRASAACIFGYVADRFGRTRALMATILLFSVASLGAATSQTVIQLLMWRALLGIGMGGEWASGAVLVSETWPPAHRNKADQHHAVRMGDRLHHSPR